MVTVIFLLSARVRKDHEPVRRSRKRLILVLSLSILNLVLLVLGAVVTPDGVSSYILVVFIVNLLAYAIYYVIMKVATGIIYIIRRRLSVCPQT